MKKLTIAIDFDGTIVEHNYPDIGKLLPRADLFMRKLEADGHHIIIWTCREGAEAEKAKEFLKSSNIPFHSFNDNNPEHTKSYNNNSRKVYADIYIDDRDWDSVISWGNIYESIRTKARTLGRD